MNLKLKAALMTVGIIGGITGLVTLSYLYPEMMLAVAVFGVLGLWVYMIYDSIYEDLKGDED